MKKLFLILFLLILVYGCSKDDNPIDNSNNSVITDTVKYLYQKSGIVDSASGNGTTIFLGYWKLDTISTKCDSIVFKFLAKTNSNYSCVSFYSLPSDTIFIQFYGLLPNGYYRNYSKTIKNPRKNTNVYSIIGTENINYIVMSNLTIYLK